MRFINLYIIIVIINFGLYLSGTGEPGKQKEASKAHSALAKIAGGVNDFATLLAIFRNYVDRYNFQAKIGVLLCRLF